MEPDDDFFEGIDMPPGGRYRMLSVGTGQAGTFEYGEVSSRAKVNTADSSSEAVCKSVPHLNSFGGDVQFIGTQGCVSCTGIYIEIEGNRLFCAHINGSLTHDLNQPRMIEGSPEYFSMRGSVA